MDALKEQLFQLAGENIYSRFLLVGVSIVAAMVIYGIFYFIVRRLTLRKDYLISPNDLKLIRYPTISIMILTGISLSLKSAGWGADTFPGMNKFLVIIIIAGVAWLAIRIVHIARIVVLKTYDVSTEDNLLARKVYTQLKILERIIDFIIILISLAIALMSIEQIRQIGVSLFASAGVAGIVLGFAAQKAIGTLLAGFQIALTQPIRLDDVVIVENEWGWIEEINLTYVVVRIWDKRRLVLPTTYFIDTPFQNWTRSTSEILGTVFIYTDYTMPVGPLRKELSRVLQESEHWDKQVDVLQVTDTNENGMEIRALMSARNSSIAWNLRVEVREKLIKFLQENHPECLPRTRVEMLPERKKKQNKE